MISGCPYTLSEIQQNMDYYPHNGRGIESVKVKYVKGIKLPIQHFQNVTAPTD